MRPIRFGLSLSCDRWRFKPPVYCAAAAATASIATGSYLMIGDRSAHKAREQPWLQMKLPEVAVDAIAGAAGELIQLTVLYPLDTIKVRCQAQSLGTMTVLQQLFAQGFNLQVLQQLYAGVLGAAVCSLVVGSVHYVTYSGSKRAALDALSGDSSAAFSGDLQKPRCKGKLLGQETAKEPNAAAPQEKAASENTAKMRSLANFFAAVTSAFVTALVEAPAELFRHNAQAGTMGPNFLREMWTVLRRDGPLGLYWGFLPYCFESWPYDITELLAYGGLQDWHHEATKDGTAIWFNHSLPAHMRDIMFGAAAGTAAVLISMPFDCIKTYMQTHGMDLGGKGVVSSAAVFFQIGVQLLEQHGWSALFVGVVPRLLQQVPAAMMCWWAIEQTKRGLAPYTETSTKS